MRQGSLSLALALGLVAAPAAAQQFSADIVSTGMPGAGPSKIYVSDGKLRMESGHGTMLADAKANTAYMLMPQQKMYMDMGEHGNFAEMFMPTNVDDPCPEWQKAARAAQPDAAAWTCSRVGDDTVGGRSVVKYQAAANDGITHYAWLDPKLRIIIKTQDSNGNSMELQNIKEGAQPATLFVLPADYRKFDMQQMRQQQQEGQ
ncbi:MAG TPA: hypothetical protein VL993_16450 [Stellaceae bacterium]|nr:hypothetical protein [Stellaceae bacterium]